MKSSSKRPHVVIAGGGTGGHLFPGVALIKELERALKGALEVTFVGTSRGLEARLIPRLGYRLELIEVSALKGGGASSWIKGALRLPGAGLSALRLVRRLKPSLVVAVGGYAAGPFTLAAATLGVPTALLEQNSAPGLTNTLLGKVVDRAFLTYAQSAEAFPAHKVEVLGNPLRRELIERAERFDYKAPEEQDTVRVLILGGSGGSLALNRDLPAALNALPEAVQRRLEVVHQVGKQSGELAGAQYERFSGQARVVEFIEEMSEAYERAHLVICRAGASTIAEVTGFGLPALYVPFSGAADDHQRLNALEVVEAGGGLMVKEGEVATGRLARLLEQLAAHPASLERLAAGARSLGRLEAGAAIAARCVELLQGEIK